MQNFLGIIVSYLFVGIIIVSSKFFQKVGEEASRKYIHIALVGWWPIAMAFFDNVYCAVIVPISFVIINYLSYKKDLIKTMERSQKDSLGTVYYAISLVLMVIYTFEIIHKPEIGLCAMAIMCFGDGLASIIGKAVKSFEYKIGKTKKTLAGSLTMLLISFIIISIYMLYKGDALWFVKSLLLSALLTIIEAVSIKGTDNITVPVIATLLLSIM